MAEGAPLPMFPHARIFRDSFLRGFPGRVLKKWLVAVVLWECFLEETPKSNSPVWMNWWWVSSGHGCARARGAPVVNLA